MKFTGRGILLDIEGTTSSIRFVYDVMFPFARRELEAYLLANWNTPQLDEACEQVARDAGFESFTAFCGDAVSDDQRRRKAQAEVIRLMDGDVKATGLKQLQGMIWQAGFESGEMKAHLYDDVLPAIEAWNRAGIDVRIYSSGSIAAQKLFFGHTQRGNILPLLKGHYDTTTGPKKESGSYRAIAKDYALPPDEILFISDVPAELDAAQSAGLSTALCIRPGNAEVSARHGHDEITVFNEIVVG